MFISFVLVFHSPIILVPTKAATLLNQAQQKIEQMTIPPDLVESLLLLGFDERGKEKTTQEKT